MAKGVLRELIIARGKQIISDCKELWSQKQNLSKLFDNIKPEQYDAILLKLSDDELIEFWNQLEHYQKEALLKTNLCFCNYHRLLFYFSCKGWRPSKEKLEWYFSIAAKEQIEQLWGAAECAVDPEDEKSEILDLLVSNNISLANQFVDANIEDVEYVIWAMPKYKRTEILSTMVESFEASTMAKLLSVCQEKNVEEEIVYGLIEEKREAEVLGEITDIDKLFGFLLSYYDNVLPDLRGKMDYTQFNNMQLQELAKCVVETQKGLLNFFDFKQLMAIYGAVDEEHKVKILSDFIVPKVQFELLKMFYEAQSQKERLAMLELMINSNWGNEVIAILDSIKEVRGLSRLEEILLKHMKEILP